MEFMTDVETRAMQSNVFQLLGYIPVAENRQLYFVSEAARDSYFDGKVIAGNFTFKYIREHRALQVNYNAETLLASNYMRFRNTQYNGIWMYCYVDAIEYVNPKTSLIRFHLDAWQTYFNNVVIRDCDIAREHAPRGYAYNYNTVVEPVDYGDYVINQESVYTLDSLSEVNTYLIISTADLVKSGGTEDEVIIKGAPGCEINGLPSAAGIYYVDENTSSLRDIFASLSDYAWVAQSIISVFPFPADFVPKQGIFSSAMGFRIGVCYGNTSPRKRVIDINWQSMLPSYTQKKLYCYPYSFFEIVMPSGNKVVIKPELINGATLSISITGSPIPDGTLLASANDYDGNINNSDLLNAGTSFSGFPSFPVQNNQFILSKSQAVSTNNLVHSQNRTDILIGAISGLASGIGQAVSNEGDASGIVNAIANTFQSAVREQQSSERDRQKIDMMQSAIGLAGNSSGGSEAVLMAVNGSLDVIIRAYTVKPEFRSKLQSYFDAYGYKSNRIGIPYLNNRPRFNYVRCNTVNIYGNIPNEHLDTIRSMFLNGVTFWHDYENVGTYGNNE